MVPYIAASSTQLMSQRFLRPTVSAAEAASSAAPTGNLAVAEPPGPVYSAVLSVVGSATSVLPAASAAKYLKGPAGFSCSRACSCSDAGMLVAASSAAASLSSLCLVESQMQLWLAQMILLQLLSPTSSMHVGNITRRTKRTRSMSTAASACFTNTLQHQQAL